MCYCELCYILFVYHLFMVLAICSMIVNTNALITVHIVMDMLSFRANYP